MALTAEQQVALRKAVKISPECANAYAARDLNAITAIMSAGRVRFKSTIIGDGTIIEAFMSVEGSDGLNSANTFLDWFRTEPQFRHVVRLMDRGELRLDNPGTIGMLMQFSTDGRMSQAVTDYLVSRAKEPDPYDRLEVEAALFDLNTGAAL